MVLQIKRASFQEVAWLLLDMFTGKYLFEIIRGRMAPTRDMKGA